MALAESIRCAVSLLVAMGLVRGAAAQPRIVDLGIPEGGDSPSARAISDDGQVVVGYYSARVGPYHRAYRWTTETGMVRLTDTTDYWTEAYGVSADGSAVAGKAGNSGDSRAFRWTAGGGVQNLGNLYGNRNSEARGISGDGLSVVGLSGTAPETGKRAFRWREQTGMENLGSLGSTSYAYATNSDGSVVTGESGFPNSRAFRWTDGVGMVPLPLLPDGIEADGRAVSADGEAIVGMCMTNGSFHHMYRWTPAEGTRNLGVPTGARDSYALTVSDDGLVVGGYCYYSSNQTTRACLWSEHLGVVDFGDYLASIGVDLTGWQLIYIRALSADGSAVAGDGVFEGQSRAWLVTGLFAPELEISLAGQCPGRQTMTWQGAQPGSRLGILFAARQGGFIIPGGTCAGTMLGLDTNRLRLVHILSAGEGSGSASESVGDSVCGGYVQAIELPTCRTSNVVQV